VKKALLSTLSLLFALSLASAQEAPASVGTPVVTGLNGPMGVLVAPGGDVYVVDPGTGGDQEITTVSPESSEEITATVGNTSRIVRVSADGSQEEVATLPSILIGQEATGGARLAIIGDTLYATSGFWAEFSGPEPMPLMASVVKLENGKVSEVADLWALENAENPDGNVKEAHPYGLAVGPDGMLYVADAGANDLLKVDPETGEASVIAVFDGIPSPIPNPARGNATESDPVPTGVAFDEAGNAYVAMLPGFPFTPGSAKVVRVTPEGEVSDYATGLSMVTDLRMAPDGTMYAVQFGQFTERGPVPNSGSVVRVTERGPEPVLEGLSFPTSIAFNAEGDAFLTLNGVGAPGSGQVVRVDDFTSN